MHRGTMKLRRESKKFRKYRNRGYHWYTGKSGKSKKASIFVMISWMSGDIKIIKNIQDKYYAKCRVCPGESRKKSWKPRTQEQQNQDFIDVQGNLENPINPDSPWRHVESRKFRSSRVLGMPRGNQMYVFSWGMCNNMWLNKICQIS